MVRKSLHIVQSNAVEGREDEFEAWYERTHVPEMLLIDGVVSAHRFARSAALDRQGDSVHFAYATLYELDGDPAEVLQRVAAAVKSGELQLSDAMAPGTASLLLEPVGEKVVDG